MSRPLGKRTGSSVTRGLLASRSRNPSVSRPLLEAVLLWRDLTLPLSILLDSGADDSVVEISIITINIQSHTNYINLVYIIITLERTVFILPVS